MSKSCLSCGKQNADDARFCAHCGTAFPAAGAGGERITGIACPECHHMNRASAQFCAQCGTDLSEQTVIAPLRREAPAVPVAGAATPPAAAPAPELFGRPPSSRHASLWVAFVVCVIVLVAAAAWRFVGQPPSSAGREVSSLPDPAPAPPPVASAPAAVPSPDVASAPPVDAASSAQAPSASAAALPSAAIAEIPASAPASASEPAANADAEQRARAVAEARDKAERAAKAKAVRDAKAKAAQEQQQQQAAAEQEAARKRADEARARAAAAPVAPPKPPAAGPRTAQEVCAGRNLISQAICESRECGKAEHANEALCMRIKAAEERRSGGAQ